MNLRFNEPNHSSSVRFSSRPPGDEPAHVTSTSMRPKRSIVRFTARSMSSGFVMSPWIPTTCSSPPSSSTAARSVSSSRPVIATLQPSSTSSSAAARPMPRLAPVMKTTWSLSPRSTLPLLVVLMSLPHLRERVAPHLAHPVDGQLVERDDALRALVRRQPLAGVRDERVAVEVAGRHDERDDLLAPALGRHAGDRDLGDGRMVLERRLDLPGINVEPAADDELLRAPGDLEAAVPVVDPAEVAGAEPAVAGQRLRRRLGPVPVAVEDLRAADEDLAVLAVEPDLDPRQRPPDATRDARAVVEVRDVEPRLGAAVALARGLAEPRLDPLRQRRRRRRRAGDREAQRAQVGVADALPAVEALVHRGDGEEDGRLLRGDRVGDVRGVEAAKKPAAGAAQEAQVHAAQPVLVRERQRVHE